MNVDTEVDLREEGFKNPVRRAVPVLCLLSLVRYLFSKTGFGISTDPVSLQRFWTHACDCFPWGQRHPGKFTTIPIGLYGDDAKYTTGQGNIEKVLGLLCNFILWCPASTRASRYLIFAIREGMIVSYERTVWPIFQHMARQLNQLHDEGVLVDGKVLRFSVTELRGDWAYHCSSLNLGRRWNAKAPCFKCDCRTEGGLGYTMDYSATPPWLQHEFTHAAFIANVLKPGPI